MVVDSCPLILSVSENKKSLIEQMKFILFDGFGTAVNIISYYPFWNPLGKKKLCSIYHIPTGYLPIPSSSRVKESCLPMANSFPPTNSSFYQYTHVRLVEILEDEMGKQDLIGVVEYVNHLNWLQTVRFLVLDVFELVEAIKFVKLNPEMEVIRKSNIVDPSNELRQKLPILNLIDELVRNIL